MGRIRGLEALFSAIRGDLKSKEDCAVAAVHCILTSSDLLCVGIGEVFSDNDADSSTELLPENWNTNQEIYCLRYRSQDLKSCYLLKISKAGCNLHIDFGKNEDKLVSTTVNTNDIVSDDFGNFSRAFKKLDDLKSQVKESILKVVETKEKSSSPIEKETSKKKASPKNGPNQQPPRAENPQYQPVPIGIPDSRHTGGPPLAFPQIGARDLDPFGRGQGGMFYDPFSGTSRSPFGGSGIGQPPQGGGRSGSGNWGLPPGAIPPGARFDPFSPINPGRSNPDPDHFRPSDYDNMYM